MLTKKKASIINMATMGVYQIVTILLGFIIPGMLLGTYGAEMHGYTSTVTNIMSYILLINAGLSTAGIQSLYKPLAEKDNNRVNEVINAVNSFYVKIGVMLTLAVIGCSVVLPFVIQGNIPWYEISGLMIVMGATSTLECFIYCKCLVLLQADQKLFVVNLTNTIALILRGIIQILLIKFNMSIMLVQAIPVILVLLRAFSLSSYVKKKYPGLDEKVKPDFSALSKRWNAFAHQIAGLVVNNTAVLILTFFTESGLVLVSIYSVYNLVFSHLYTLMTMIFSTGTIASFGTLMHEKRDDKLRSMYDIYEFSYYIATAFIYSVTSCMIIPFVKLYTAKMVGIVYVDVKLAALFVIIGILNNLRVPCNTMITGAGHFKETQWRAIAEAVINLAVSLVLVPFIGIYGVLVGSICSFLYRVSDIIYYSHKYILKKSVISAIRRIIRVFLGVTGTVAIFMTFVIGWNNISTFPSINSWMMWVVYAAISAVISGMVIFILNFALENKSIFRVFRFLLGKKRKK